MSRSRGVGTAAPRSACFSMMAAPTSMSQVSSSDEVLKASSPRSANAPQALRILLRAPHVDVGALRDARLRVVVERADRARRRADDQRVVREALALGDQRTGADQRVLADP